MLSIGERIRQARTERGITQEALGKRLEVSKNAVTQWETGATVPRTRRLRQIEVALSLPVGALTGSDTTSAQTEIRTANPDVYSIPLLDYVLAHRSAGLNYDGGDVLLADEEVSDRAFALVVEGDGMAPEYQAGDRIVIDPDVTPEPGDAVIARLDGREEATFKRYRPRGYDAEGREIVELRPDNNHWPTLYIDADSPGHIVGPVVEHRRKPRRR
jgi:SOS-response transcriptional repressor LexA